MKLSVWILNRPTTQPKKEVLWLYTFLSFACALLMLVYKYLTEVDVNSLQGIGHFSQCSGSNSLQWFHTNHSKGFYYVCSSFINGLTTQTSTSSQNQLVHMTCSKPGSCHMSQRTLIPPPPHPRILSYILLQCFKMYSISIDSFVYFCLKFFHLNCGNLWERPSECVHQCTKTNTCFLFLRPL